MADLESIRRLRRGASAWNAFGREANASDLTHVEIRHADLRGADFRGVDFDGSSFVGVDFRGADFRRARLNGVNVSETSFEGADLGDAELKGADFKWVCLRDARLCGAEAFDLRIRHSSLARVDLSSARLRAGHIYNSDLHAAAIAGLTIEHAVIKRPAAEPELIRALEAAGAVMELPNLPTVGEWRDWDAFVVRIDGDDLGLIVHAGRSYWMAENRWDFFVSHASVDTEAVARPLAEALRARHQRVWFDGREVRAGDDLAHVIERGIEGALFGVVVLSESFLDRKWTEIELDALSRKRMFLVRHGVKPERLGELRAGLEDRVSLSSELGIERVADGLIEAVSAVPHSR